jgi:hypothetical protein
MYKPRASRRLVLATILSTIALLAAVLPAWADAPPGPYSNGFETNRSSWFDASNGGFGTLTRQEDPYTNAGGYAEDIQPATGDWHARITGDPCAAPAAPCLGPFTRWGGYTDKFPIGGYRTYMSIYLDVEWAATHEDARFDYLSSINDIAGDHLQDYDFNAGTNRPEDSEDPPGFYINASTNTFRHSSFPQNECPAPSAPPNKCRLPVHIETSGWYTFRHTFRDDGGFLAVDFDIFSSSGGNVANWTIYTGNPMAAVGGNRAGWFANEEIPELPIDDSKRTGLNLALTPATAINAAVVGARHTVTATATSTEPNRPAPGPGVPVEFEVIAGPNAGQTSEPANTGCSSDDCTTDESGRVSWTYASNGVSGTDTIEACFEERPAAVHRPEDEPRTCARATKIWGRTSGKVTGGGQIEGDPVFALNGTLLSVPALMPSLASPGSQANFGFVVQSSGTTPKGNLEYQDKPAGVRIKATSFTSLVIFAGSCGPDSRAEFSGMAQVTRPTGTTTESFTVRVDDCGEPGTADTFEITTSGPYSNGPSTLIGGNIQIH